MATAYSEVQGCPFGGHHDQQPRIESDVPLEQINAGNFGLAIALYRARDRDGAASPEDCALASPAFRNIGDFGAAADWLQKARLIDPFSEAHAISAGQQTLTVRGTYSFVPGIADLKSIASR